jgi:hypothetical protein
MLHGMPTTPPENSASTVSGDDLQEIANRVATLLSLRTPSIPGIVQAGMPQPPQPQQIIAIDVNQLADLVASKVLSALAVTGTTGLGADDSSPVSG